MRALEAGIAAVSLWMARVGGVLLLAAALVISFEILARKLLFLPFNVGTELSTYALAAGGSWSFAYALLKRAHVRVDILRKVFSPLGRALLDVAALASLAALAIVLAGYAAQTVATSWTLGATENTPLATPLIIPQGMWLIGLAWFAFVAFEQIIRALAALAGRRLDAVAAIAGPAGAEEELEEALAATAPGAGQAG